MMETFCVVCRAMIPPERAAKKSNTCSPACAKALKKARRVATDAKRCHHCGKPSTPEERQEYQQWRRETGRLKKRGRPAKQPAAKAADKPVAGDCKNCQHGTAGQPDCDFECVTRKATEAQ